MTQDGTEVTGETPLASKLRELERLVEQLKGAPPPDRLPLLETALRLVEECQAFIDSEVRA
ncbi:MAG: hypothetical protein ACYC55_00710 [Candidatus Geothermincolia bacterium]